MTRCTVAGLFCALLALGSAHAEGRLVSAGFQKTPLRQAAAELSRQSGVDIIVAEDVDGTLTASFENKPLEQILRLIAASQGLELQQVGTAWMLSQRTAAAPEVTVPGAAPPTVSIRFDKTEIRDALAQLSKVAGANFVVSKDVRGTVTASFENQSLDQVITSLAQLLGLEVELVENVFVVRNPRAADAAQPAEAMLPGAQLPVREGAGALLPGEAPKSILTDPGQAPGGVVGGPNEVAPTPARTGTTRVTIPVENLPASTVAAMLGAGSLDNQGRYVPPPVLGGQRTRPAGTNDPYANLPPGSRVSRNGTILLPNGATILPSGVTIAPDGTVIQPRVNPHLTVPWGTTLPTQGTTYTNPNQQVLGGQIGGVPFGVTHGGGVTIRPPTINAGPVSVTLPGVTVGNQPHQQLQTVPQQQLPKVYAGNTAPTVHIGERPVNWYYGLPPGWHYTPPQGAGNFYPGFTQPVGTGTTLPRQTAGD